MIVPRVANGVLPGALVIGCLALAWLVAESLSGNAPRSAPTGRVVVALAPAEPAPGARTLPPAPIRLAPIQNFSATVARPIFEPSRRAPDVPVAAKAPVPAAPFDLALEGIVFSKDTKLAVVFPGAGGKPIRLREGDEYRGWTLAKIAAKEAAFQRNGTVKNLVLDFDGAASAGDGAAGATAPRIGPRTRGYLRPLRAQPKTQVQPKTGGDSN